MFRLHILLSFFLFFGQDSPKPSIAGIVLRSGSGEPLSRAQLTLTRIAPEVAGNSSAIRTVLTESDGKFIFEDLEAGEYRLSAARNGYTQQSYGQPRPNLPGATISLAAGQTLKNVTFRLIQAGVLTGRVRDTQGEPLAGLEVSLMNATYDDEGRLNLSREREARTDDRGEYRFYWISPGRYYVRVGKPQHRDEFPIVDDRNFQTTYYPNTVDPAQASAVDFQPGAEISAIDVMMPHLRDIVFADEWWIR